MKWKREHGRPNLSLYGVIYATFGLGVHRPAQMPRPARGEFCPSYFPPIVLLHSPESPTFRALVMHSQNHFSSQSQQRRCAKAKHFQRLVGFALDAYRSKMKRFYLNTGYTVKSPGSERRIGHPVLPLYKLFSLHYRICRATQSRETYSMPLYAPSLNEHKMSHSWSMSTPLFSHI
jgi:hypothetical protein